MTNPGTSFQYVEDMKKLTYKVSSKMKKNAKHFTVASVEENEGKSTVAANLALALAEESRESIVDRCGSSQTFTIQDFWIESGKKYSSLEKY